MKATKQTQGETLKRIAQLLDAGLCALDPMKRDDQRAASAKAFIEARALLDKILTPPAAVANAAVKAIEALSVPAGKWIRQFDRSNKKAIEASEATNCKVCLSPLRLARILPVHVGSKSVGYAHYACAAWIHPIDCQCRSCDRRRILASKPLTYSGHTIMLPPQNFEQLLAQKTEADDPTAAAESLKYCACTHEADDHKRDELDNLLECKVGGCACDHFHYPDPAADKVTISYGNTKIGEATIS